MRGNDNGFSIFDVGLKAFQPVCAGPFETIEIYDSFASEHTRGRLIGFQRSVEFPSFVRGIEIVRRDENLESMRFRGLEDSLHVLNRIVFLKTFANKRPRETFLAQDVVLRIDEYDCSVFPMNIHSYLLFEFSDGRNRFDDRPDLSENGSKCQFVLPEKSFDSARDFLSVGFERKVTSVQ